MKIYSVLILFVTFCTGTLQAQNILTKVLWETPDSIFIPHSQRVAENNFKYIEDNPTEFRHEPREYSFSLYEVYLAENKVFEGGGSVKVSSKTEYIDGVKHGKVEYFIRDTILILSGYYCNNLPCGVYKVYNYTAEMNDLEKYDNRLAYMMNFSSKSGKANGAAIYYTSSSEKFRKDIDSNDLNIKESVIRYDKVSEIYTYRNGKKHGPSFKYTYPTNEDGQLRGYLLWQNDKIIDGKYLHSNGIVKYKNGNLVKSWSYSKNSGKLIRSQNRSFIDRLFNFNKLIFPVKRVVTGKMDYEEYINKKLK